MSEKIYDDDRIWPCPSCGTPTAKGHTCILCAGHPNQSRSKRKYDSTIARIAGNLASGVFDLPALNNIGVLGINSENRNVVNGAVAVARAIVAEVERTETTTKEF